MKYNVLANKIKMPSIGFGTYKLEDGNQTVDAVKYALEVGYRHLDCAEIYDNQISVGKAIKQSNVDRKDIFVTSKIWNSDKGYESTKKAFNKILNDLELEYLDLLLIHWPIGRDFKNNWKEINSQTWKAMEELYQEGKIKSIGVSNFLVHHLEELKKTAKITPMVNQLEFHPGYMQPEIVDYCKNNNIVVQAWSPFSQSQILEHKKLLELANKYKVTTAQLILNWIIQKDIVPLPKSKTFERIKSNLAVFDFSISKEDIKIIDELPDCSGLDLHPDEVEF
ncbi:aldo/keto reductase [Mycoplasma bradburyae]|uniref:Aldo/keto reductase n=1 Tax=Mycoplasma bradburyae TaxID=2963128 RepID=A0AAW6HQU6_9MOLU|nr:aldo/keto reductase [Mycoplasma bradburyae]MDC4183365.1 aldo/keto reductase [Mycoplasma bradburyae]